MRTLYSYGSQILVTSLSLPLCGREQCGGILSNEIIDQRKDILDKALSERCRESRELIWAFLILMDQMQDSLRNWFYLE